MSFSPIKKWRMSFFYLIGFLFKSFLFKKLLNLFIKIHTRTDFLSIMIFSRACKSSKWTYPNKHGQQEEDSFIHHLSEKINDTDSKVPFLFFKKDCIFLIKRILTYFFKKTIIFFQYLAFLEKIDIIKVSYFKNKNLSNATNTIIKIPLLSNQTIQGQRTLSGALGKTDKKPRFS